MNYNKSIYAFSAFVGLGLLGMVAAARRRNKNK